MVEHLPAPAELRELVLERVEAVRAVGDDLAKAVTREVPDVLPLHRLVEVLLAETPRDLTVAPLLLHHDERHAGGLQDLHYQLGDLLIPTSKGGRTAHPSTVLDFPSLL